MSRFIDAEVFAERLLNAWDTADKEKKSEIVAILSDIVTPILVGTPTADVVPRAEVAREIFEEIEKYMMDSVDVTHTAYKTIGTSTFAILKKKYTEVRE